MRSSAWVVVVLTLASSACGRAEKPAPSPPPAPPVELSLKPVAPGTADRAIVFVHGLDGDPEDTFKHASSKASWPKLIEMDMRPFAGVDPPPPLAAYSTYTLDYRQVYRSESNIEEGAKQIARYLVATGLFERHNHVWFVTHSLGGVLMKRVLELYSSEQYDRLLRRVAGIFFMGVPANGSVLADLAASDKARLLLEIFGKNYRMIRDLRPETAAAFLDSLETDWNSFLRARQQNAPPYVHCAYEVDPQFGLARIVPKLFAQTCLDSSSLPISGTHISMVKPTSITSPNYEWARMEIGNDAYQLRKWGAVFREPSGETLGEIIDDFRALHREPPDKSGVLLVSEDVSYADPSSETIAGTLLLKRTLYSAPNVAAFLNEIAAANRCVSVKASSDRRQLVVTISGATTSCRAQLSRRVVCRNVDCRR